MRTFRVIGLISAAVLVVGACSATAATAVPTLVPTIAPTVAAPSAAAPSAAPPSTAAPSAATSAAAGAGQSVSIKNFNFSPPTVTAKTGEMITWTNGDDVGHTVTFDDASVKSSGTLTTGTTFSVSIDKAGTYTYHCSIHPSMKGTVTVA